MAQFSRGRLVKDQKVVGTELCHLLCNLLEPPFLLGGGFSWLVGVQLVGGRKVPFPPFPKIRNSNLPTTEVTTTSYTFTSCVLGLLGNVSF